MSELPPELEAMVEQAFHDCPFLKCETPNPASRKRIIGELAAAIAPHIDALLAAKVEECAKAAWGAPVLEDHGLKDGDFPAFRYGKDCAVAAIRSLT